MSELYDIVPGTVAQSIGSEKGKCHVTMVCDGVNGDSVNAPLGCQFQAPYISSQLIKNDYNQVWASVSGLCTPNGTFRGEHLNGFTVFCHAQLNCFVTGHCPKDY